MEPPVDAPPEPEPRPESEAAPEPYRCPRCGAPHDPYQEYCLECGSRLVPLRPQAFSIWRRETWTRESPIWFWATFLALLLIALVAAAIVLAATRDDDGDEAGAPAQSGPATSQILPTNVPTPPPVTTTGLPTTVTDIPTLDTNTTPTTGTTGTTTAPTTGTTTTGATGTVLSWPAGRRGYTVILSSVPKSRGRAAAVAQAERAIDQGLDEVGVLDSDNFTSLTQGYWVVFSGIHDTESQARSSLATARSSGYPVAYAREVTP